MYVTVIPSGSSIIQGMVQIRFGCYLDEDDHDYSVHYVQVEGVWHNNPFHNHFIIVDPYISDEDILKEADKWCKAAYKDWKKDDPIDLKNDKTTFPDPVTPEQQAACEALVAHLEVTPLSSHVDEEEEKKK